jgi:hypothetical protein
MKVVEKYYNEKGELGVLISTGWGSGWSTWNNKELAYDKRIIEKWLEKVSADDMCDYIESLEYERPYMGGYDNLHLEFIPRGTMFRIHEYDGAESIEIVESMGMMMA